MKPIDVMIAEDYLLYREGIIDVLSELPHVRLTGVAVNGRELLDLAATTPPDIVLMDVRMPELDGIAATKALLERYPDVGVIALTVHEDEWYLAQMVLAGARGYLYKESTEDILAQAIEEVHGGGCYYSPSTQRRLTSLLKNLLPPVPGSEKNGKLLTDEEVAFIQLTCEGCALKEIVDKLGITIDQAKRYRPALIEKTGSRTWADVVRYALRYNLLQ
ncbi:MAG TPA: response regulator transcription factor [Flavisolibacter sp.]|jgi:DNA-binding NarL/FixJ family response regulator|nr:response regulator transcription factor [Flavisolibacter sp.]